MLSRPVAVPDAPSPLLEVVAHGRFVSAVSVHPAGRLFLSAGEDCYVNVWTLPAAAGEKLALRHSLRAGKGVVVGAAFVGGGGGSVVAAMHDLLALPRFEGC